MITWSKDELRRVASADDLHVSPFREDGVTYGTPTWVWSVAVGDSLYVRAYNGQDSSWYGAALRQKAGRITAAGIRKEVAFAPVEGPFNDQIDDAYREKCKGRGWRSRWKRIKRLIQPEYARSVHGEKCRRRATECTRSSNLGCAIDVRGVGAEKC